MIAALAFAAVEWTAAVGAVVAGVHAGATGSLLFTGISGAAAIVASLLRSLAFGRAAARRCDAMMANLDRLLGAASDRGAR